MSRSDYDDMPMGRGNKSRRNNGGRKSYIFALMGVLIILIVVIVLMVFNGEGTEETEKRPEPGLGVEVTEVEEVEVEVPEAREPEKNESGDPVTEAEEKEEVAPDEVAEPAEDVPEAVETTEETEAVENAATETSTEVETAEAVPEAEEESEEVPAPVEGETAETGTEGNAEGEFIRYTVEEGDSLSSIAQSFAIAPDTLASVNRIQNASNIRTGDELIIPPVDGKLYQVKANDTVELIMKRFGLEPSLKDYFLSLNLTDGSLKGKSYLFIPQQSLEDQSPFIRPTDGEVDKVFGETWKDEVLQGVTFSMEPGDAVLAIADGTVTDVGTDRDYGRFVTVMHEDFYKSTYYSLEMINVKLGEEVHQGDVIATVGTSSKYFGSSKLYFKLEQGRVKLDPLLFF